MNGFTGSGLNPYNSLLNNFTMPSSTGLQTNMTPEQWMPNPIGSVGSFGSSLRQDDVNPGFGFNMPTLQLGLTGLGTLAGIFNSFSQNRQQRDQFNYYRNLADTNMNNSIKNYNTRLEDRARARVAAEGGTQEDIDAYLEKNRLERT